MTSVLITNLERDGAHLEFADHGGATLASAGAMSLMQARFEPGWRWSQDVAPMAGTSSCQVRHLGYVLSGRMHVVMDDGSEADLGPGDAFDLPAGHDAYVVGDEACLMVDISPEVMGYAAATGAENADRYLDLVRRGYAAFNAGDVDALVSLMSHDVVQHAPGNSPISGDHKGIEAVLAYYGKIADMTDGTFRVDLIDVHGDGRGHVVAIHQSTATRGGTTRVSRGSILFSFLGDKATDLLEMHADLAGDDAFMS